MNFINFICTIIMTSSFVYATPLVQTISYKPPKSSKKSNFYVIAPKSENDIIPIPTKEVIPVLYTNSVPLSSLSIKKKKESFINMLLPSILLAKYKIELEKKKLLQLSKKERLEERDIQWLKKELDLYNAKNYVELYFAMRTHPNSIIIAQAIVESGWGTSKFFQKANNIFGVWSFDTQDKRMVANKKRGKRSVYLKKYKSLAESVDDYFLNLSKNTNYKTFREKRLETQNPFTLVNYLEKYSERGKAYIEDIKEIIRSNNLEKYDHYTLAF